MNKGKTLPDLLPSDTFLVTPPAHRCPDSSGIIQKSSSFFFMLEGAETVQPPAMFSLNTKKKSHHSTVRWPLLRQSNAPAEAPSSRLSAGRRASLGQEVASAGVHSAGHRPRVKHTAPEKGGRRTLST